VIALIVGLVLAEHVAAFVVAVLAARAGNLTFGLRRKPNGGARNG
jgi:hypothetical protein